MNKKVILAEDDAAIADIYSIILQKSGFDVEVMGLGQDVIKRVQAIDNSEAPKPDIFLLDLILPDINGSEVLAQIRKTGATKDIKVFILTNQEYSQFDKMGEVKPDKFIIKANITPTQLAELIKKDLA